MSKRKTNVIAGGSKDHDEDELLNEQNSFMRGGGGGGNDGPIGSNATGGAGDGLKKGKTAVKTS